MDPSKVNDEVSSEVEVKAAVSRLFPHRDSVHTHLHAEHFKQ